MHKSAIGVMTLITGYVLQFSGFEPNQEQTQVVQVSIVFLYGMLPLICYVIGAYLFSKFTLDENEHQRMSIALEKRRATRVTG